VTTGGIKLNARAPDKGSTINIPSQAEENACQERAKSEMATTNKASAFAKKDLNSAGVEAAAV